MLSIHWSSLKSHSTKAPSFSLVCIFYFQFYTTMNWTLNIIVFRFDKMPIEKQERRRERQKNAYVMALPNQYKSQRKFCELECWMVAILQCSYLLCILWYRTYKDISLIRNHSIVMFLFSYKKATYKSVPDG